jgi:hypothetical protein
MTTSTIKGNPLQQLQAKVENKADVGSNPTGPLRLSSSTRQGRTADVVSADGCGISCKTTKGNG